jgi:hypothetical protein
MVTPDRARNAAGAWASRADLAWAVRRRWSRRELPPSYLVIFATP